MSNSRKRRAEEGSRINQILRQAWWVPFAGVLAVAQLWVALAFWYGDGTSNILDAESTAAGISLGVGGAAALAAGLWIRPQRRSMGDALITVGALLGAIWFWTVVMTPIAIAVIVGVVVSYVRSPAPATDTP
ncbi:MAG: hypothetical protein H0U53_05890 [Actinobacteria bacterium]|nr:hypothetical protein [Actinomycetota bacterium]